MRAFAGLYVVLALIALAIWSAGRVARPDVSPALVVLAGLLPLALGVLWTWLVRISREYRLYRDSLEVEAGILARSIENLQLFRVRDLSLSQSVLARLLGVGDIAVTSTDRSTARLLIRGVADPRGLYETLRDLVADSQATRRTLIVEDDGPPAGRD
jgi:uncharacterized membrane protein YdbT with pleckstrin-like domain